MAIGLEIEDYIKEGIQKAYNQHIVLKTDFSNLQLKITEYLFTVNVLQQLIEWKKNNSIYCIHPEYSANKFVNNAFEDSKIKGDDIFNLELITRDLHCSLRKGRIDIAITTDDYIPRSLIGIEIKGIISSLVNVVSDIRRLVHALEEIDQISQNSIEKCYCAFLWRLDDPTKVLDNNMYREKYNHFVNEINNKLTLFKNCNIQTFDIVKILYEDISKDFSGHLDYREVAAETGAVVGCLIKLERQ